MISQIMFRGCPPPFFAMSNETGEGKRRINVKWKENGGRKKEIERERDRASSLT